MKILILTITLSILNASSPEIPEQVVDNHLIEYVNMSPPVIDPETGEPTVSEKWVVDGSELSLPKSRVLIRGRCKVVHDKNGFIEKVIDLSDTNE